MSIFRKKSATAQQKAQQAQMRIFIRLACCAYLIYFVIVPLIKPASEEDAMSPAVRIVAVIAFIIATAAILIFAIRELIVNLKAGMFKASAYEDDAVIEAGTKSAAIEAADDSEDTDEGPGLDENEYDEYDEDDEDDEDEYDEE